VIDTNVIVAALKSQRGAANRLLRLFGANKFIHSISAEKLSVPGVKDFIESRSKRGSRVKFLKVLEAAPDVEPDEEDKL
jgi:predicted nucleic acid-binding protein